MIKKFSKEVERIFRLKVPFEDLYTSVFLLRTEQGNVLVDCATYASDVEDYIVPALKKMGLSITDMRYIVLTHKHCDHAGGLTKILKIHPTIEIIDTACEISKDLEIYLLKGHTQDCIGLLDKSTGTLISGDGLQGAGVGKYRCSIQSKDEYIKTIEKIKQDERIQNILFSHAYEPWYQDGVFGREKILKILQDCINVIKRGK